MDMKRVAGFAAVITALDAFAFFSVWRQLDTELSFWMFAANLVVAVVMIAAATARHVQSPPKQKVGQDAAASDQK